MTPLEALMLLVIQQHEPYPVREEELLNEVEALYEKHGSAEAALAALKEEQGKKVLH